MYPVWGEHSLPAVADDIIVALNLRSPAIHSASGVGTQPYGIGASPPVARRITLSRTAAREPATTEAVIDLYEFDYTRHLAERFEKKNLVLRAALVLMAIIRGLFTLRKNAPRGAQTFVARLQVGLLIGVLFLYAVLLAVLAVAIATQLLDLVGSLISAAPDGRPATEGQASPTPAPTPERPPAEESGDPNLLSGLWQRVSAAARAVADVVTAFVLPMLALVWLLAPPRAKIKRFLTDGATDYLTIDYYLRGQEGAEELHGGLRSLIDTLAGLGYRRIDLAAYSFGSVVAFNVVFPGRRPDPSGPVSAIESLFTIGSPYDLVRRIRPGYFRARHALPEHPKRWINIYVPKDILGSNLRNDSDQDQPAREVMVETSAEPDELPVPRNVVYLPGGIPREGPSPGDLLGFRGFQVHARYWDPSQQNESTCFEEMVSELYGDDEILGAQPVVAST